MACNCDSTDWKATLNRMPPNTAQLTVTGTAKCATSGYKSVHLEAVTPPGFNPAILLLELKWGEPVGPGEDVRTSHFVEYERANSDQYKEVEIVNCSHKRIKVAVIS